MDSQNIYLAGAPCEQLRRLGDSQRVEVVEADGQSCSCYCHSVEGAASGAVAALVYTPLTPMMIPVLAVARFRLGILLGVPADQLITCRR